MKTPRLDDQLCFALYAASRMVTRAFKPVLVEIGLTYPQYLVMMVLWEWDDEGNNAHSVGELGERLYLDSGTLTPLLKRLQDRDLVIRRRSDSDERVMCIGVTAAGRELAKVAHKIPYSLACYAREGDEQRLAGLRETVRELADRLAEAPPNQS